MSTRNSSLYLPVLSILIAVELVMAFSMFGYIVIPPISLTFMPLPVLVGALLFGPMEGLFLGGVFGLTSMWKASVSATAYADQIFSPFISGAPLASLILSVGTRMVFGLVAGYLFLYVKKCVKYKRIGIIVAAFVAEFLHSLIVTASIQIMFPEAGISIDYTIFRILSLKNILEFGIIGIFVLVAYCMSISKEIRILKDEINRIEGIKAHPKVVLGLIGFISLIFMLTTGLWYHFYSRTEIVLKESGVVFSEKMLSQFWQLGIQFLVAVIALFLIVSIVLVLTEKYLLEISYQAKRDMMTGLYNKITLERYVDIELENGCSTGFLLILDVDNFKNFNDTYGHPVGDQVLIGISSILRVYFSEYGVIGRLGGDEFCVYVDGIPESKIINDVNRVCCDVANMSICGEKNASCSIGVTFCKGKCSFSEVYAAADRALYHSKKLGKNCFSFEGR